VEILPFRDVAMERKRHPLRSGPQMRMYRRREAAAWDVLVPSADAERTSGITSSVPRSCPRRSSQGVEHELLIKLLDPSLRHEAQAFQNRPHRNVVRHGRHVNAGSGGLGEEPIDEETHRFGAISHPAHRPGVDHDANLEGPSRERAAGWEIRLNLADAPALNLDREISVDLARDAQTPRRCVRLVRMALATSRPRDG